MTRTIKASLKLPAVKVIYRQLPAETAGNRYLLKICLRQKGILHAEQITCRHCK